MTDTLQTRRATRVLLLEDSDIDAEIICAHLQRTQFDVDIVRASCRPEYEQAIASHTLDLILADYSLPDFNGFDALVIARDKVPHVPFIFVSGVVGEDLAIDALREGATDYVLKRSLGRLPRAVERALAEEDERRRRREAEAALSASEARQREVELLFRLATEAAGIGVWHLDLERNQLWFDDGLRRLVDAPAGFVSDYGTMLRDAVHPEDRDLVNAALHLALQPDAPPLEYEHRVIGLRDRQVRWVSIKGRRITGSDGRPRLIGTALDVTEQRRISEALRRTNQDLEERVTQRTRERDRIWNLSVDLMGVCRPDGSLVAVNPAWQRVLGWSPEDVHEANLAVFIHPDDLGATQQSLTALLESAGTAAFDVRLRRGDEQYRWIRWTASRDDGLFYVIGRDVTEERAAAEALAATNRELKAQIGERSRVEATLQQMQRLEAVGQLTSGVAHDFNNLLTVVLSNIALIERLLQQRPETIDERVLQRLASMRNAAQRGATLTTQLLAFSRRQRLEPQEVDFNDVVLGMRDLLQTTMGGSVVIDTALAPQLWRAMVDPTQLELIILNLAINARDAMEVGGTLRVETRNVTLERAPLRAEEPEPGDYVALTVTDTGSGMSEEVLAKAFEPFFTTKGVGKGSGLGLAQVYGFAKQSGGGVRIDTRLGQGTSVHVFMPRARSEVPGGTLPHEAANAPYATQEQERRHQTLLLVDDDDDVREVTAAVLEIHGYEVLTANSGPAALDVVARHAGIAAVIADFAMPGMNGAELGRLLKRSHPELPVLFVTGFADLGALCDVNEEFVLQKPLPEGAMVERLQRLLAPRGSRPVTEPRALSRA
nr:hybrid sensor histidine kinase/response regulator [uncultured Caldimonas sp.]